MRSLTLVTILSRFTLISTMLLVGTATADWGEWGPWGDCSRTCDGGVASRARPCAPGTACPGRAVHYRTCNKQPCLLSVGRDHSLSRQCAAYDGLERPTAELWRWRGDASEACALWCEQAGQGVRMRMSPSVADGTRCDDVSHDMCVAGKCWHVGCDYVLGSAKVTDECGVCGGDGTSCRQPVTPAAPTTAPPGDHQWRETNFSDCSVSCGVGAQMTSYVCVATDTNVTFGVDIDVTNENETACDNVTRPSPKARACYRPSCDFDWIVDDWGACSRRCGEGVRARDVSCVIKARDGLFRYVIDDFCVQERPAVTSSCNDMDCPVLASEDTTTNASGHLTLSTTSSMSPSDVLSNATRSVFATVTPSSVTSEIASSTSRGGTTEAPMIEWIGETDADLSGEGTDESRKSPKMAPEPIGVYDVGRGDDTYTGSGGGTYDVVLDPEGIGGEGIAPYRNDMNENEAISNKPRFVTSEWGPCSTTCGPGLRRRKVQCKVFSARYNAVINQPSAVCSGFRPHGSAPCNIGVCRETKPSTAFTWRFSGYSICSASCKGGVQHPVFTCVGMKDYRPVLREYCETLQRPPMPSRQCNNVPCAPRWHEDDFGACSASCGGGVRTRTVECVQDATAGWEVVADAMCQAAPSPPGRELCNQQDCPSTWRAGEWAECSVTCGVGVQKRPLSCEQRQSERQSAVRRRPSACRAVSARRPPTERPCTAPVPCPTKAPRAPRPRHRIKVDRSTYVQTSYIRAAQLSVGGRAVVLAGSDVSFRCPARRFPRARIVWRRRDAPRGSAPLSARGRVKSRKGMLRVRRVRASDAGVYTCVAGNTTAEVRLELHPNADAAREQFRERVGRMLENEAFIEAVRVRRARFYVKPRRIFTLSYVLAKFSFDKIPFAFYSSEWSACSRTCGGAGIKHRHIRCELVLPDYYLIVDDEYCLRKGHQPPIESRDCGYEECPHWEVGRWSKCSSKICMRPTKGALTRSLYCVGRGELQPHAMCNATLAPARRQECSRPDCYATWSTTAWTKCSRSCGGRGVQTRALQCVWITNHQSAGIHCTRLPRPLVSKTCDTPSCATAGCHDERSYCSLIPMLRMCDLSQYSSECCLSCKFHVLNEQLLQMSQTRRGARPRDSS